MYIGPTPHPQDTSTLHMRIVLAGRYPPAIISRVTVTIWERYHLEDHGLVSG